MSEPFDAIVIGTGQAGPPLAVRLAQSGRKTAILERKLFGGTCVNVGCIPTKTLIASARAAHVARRGADFGVLCDGPLRVDMARVKARKDEVVRQSNEGVTKWLRKTPNVTVIEGHGRFEGPHAVAVDDRRLEAPEIFINTGGRAERSRHARARRRPVSHQHRHDGRRLPAGAPGRRRRQLHRARVRADVPALRQRGHGRRNGRRASSRARTPEISAAVQDDPRRRRHRVPAQRRNAWPSQPRPRGVARRT